MDELLHDPEIGQLRRFSLELKQQVVGQPEAIDKLTDSLSRLIAGIHDPHRPLLAMLFMGPTGVGKTETVRALARILFGHQRAFTRINCQEFTSHFNLSKLLGSPPGYVGGDIKPLVSQENLDRHFITALAEGSGLVCQTDTLMGEVLGGGGQSPLSLVLFDEVEKAHPKLWDLLLGVLEDGTLVLGNNEESDFRNSIIILTSNVGSSAMRTLLSHEGIGFDSGSEVTLIDMQKSAIHAARKIFPVEFLNRFDQLVTFAPLKDHHLLRILDLQLSRFHQRTLQARCPFLVHLTPNAKFKLIRHEADPALGARPLNRALDQLVVTPLSHFVVQGKVNPGDLIVVDCNKLGMRYYRRRGGVADSDESAGGDLPRVKWAVAEISTVDDGGEKEDITEEVKRVAAQAAAGTSATEGRQPRHDGEEGG
ncbi:MAG: ATP-dependent Clp protease ATP-binding subunit [bacterium]|nr:ATP-dependent Clp protease ATP-binding subunit [bacterium]